MAEIAKPEGFPRIVCIIGSARFHEEAARADYEESLIGKIVVRGAEYSAEQKKQVEYHKGRLDEVTKRKIDLADEIIVINKANYIGVATRQQLEYALIGQKPVRYMFPID